MFFSSWIGIARVVVVGVAAYFSLIALLRVSGKRTLSKMNAFDFVVTVALGSTFATMLLSKQVPLAEGLTAFAVLFGLQFVVAWLSVRSSFVRQIVKSQPTLLYYQGEFLEEAMKRERVTEAEVYAAIRAQGLKSLEATFAVVLETNGSFAAVQTSDEGRPTALKGICR
jgi:uncharacterized membrane protein YcaP (DUF421 family)